MPPNFLKCPLQRVQIRISPTFLRCSNLILICHIRIKCIRCTNTVKRIHDKPNIGSSRSVIGFRVFFRRYVIKSPKLKEPLLFCTTRFPTTEGIPSTYFTKLFNYYMNYCAEGSSVIYWRICIIRELLKP